jgi:dipeptide/tripeptide permease
LVVVEDAKDALKLLWVLVASAAVLGIVFVLGSRGVGPFTSSAYAIGMGRASLSFSLPYLGTLVINPASAGDKFAMAFSVAWFLLLTSTTRPRRLAAGAAAPDGSAKL